MFSKFKYEQVPLSAITLDLNNPRIVSQKPLKTETAVVKYLFEHEDLADFLKRVATEGKNRGAELPYIVKSGKSGFTVIEGNTRIAAYKLLTGELLPPEEFADEVPEIAQEMQDTLRLVDCSIAPSRASLDRIMARSHFGRGEKVQWSYLGSRQAVYRRWENGETLVHLARTFEISQSDVRDLILEYLVYLESLKLTWTDEERETLLNPNLQFNPPIRFLQTSGHKEAIGISLDRVNLKVKLEDDEARNKFRHMIEAFIVNPKKGVRATSSYNDVFGDYEPLPATSTEAAADETNTSPGEGNKGETGDGEAPGDTSKFSPKKYCLFQYDVTIKSALLVKLMYECSRLSANTYPAAATSLLRSLLESLLKHIIDQQKGNPDDKRLSLENAIDLCLSSKIKLPKEDKDVLKSFRKEHLDYVNLGVHGNVIPNLMRTLAARDAIDQFIKRNI